MRQWLIACGVVAVTWLGTAPAGAFECPSRIDEARAAVQKAQAALDKAKAAAKAAARGLYIGPGMNLSSGRSRWRSDKAVPAYPVHSDAYSRS